MAEELGLDDNVGAVNPMILAANNHTIFQTNGGTFVDKLSDGLTKGVAASLIATGNSLYNTAVAVGNIFGADSKYVKTGDAIKYFDDDLGKYYSENSAGIGIVGELAAMLVPGTIGVKALRFAQAGKFGKNFEVATGLFGSKQKEFLDLAKQEIAAGTVYDTLSANKVRAVLLGAGNQVLDAMAFEAAIVATMKVAPALDKEEVDWMNLAMDSGRNMIFAGILGGTIGGVIEYAAVKGQLNKFLRLETSKNRQYELVPQIGAVKLDGGTKIARQYVDRAGKDDLLSPESLLSPTDPKQVGLTKSSRKTIDQNIANDFNVLAGGDEQLGQALKNNIDSIGNLDDAAGVIGGVEKVSRLASARNPEIPTTKHPNSWGVNPLKLERNQLVLDMSQTSTHGDLLITEPVPTVADFATKGAGVTRLKSGDLVAGGHNFKAPGKNVDLTELSPIEANTYWTSWSLAPKLHVNEVIDVKDLGKAQKALLEQPKDAQFVGAPGGVEIKSYEDLALYVRGQKEKLVEDLLLQGKNADEVARIADVDREFVENTASGGAWNLFGKVDYQAPHYAVLTYDTVSVQSRPVMEGILDVHMRVKQAQTNALTTTDKFFGPDSADLPRDLTAQARKANPADITQGVITSSSANYGTFQAEMEWLGKYVGQKIKQDFQAAIDTLFGVEVAIRNSPQFMAEFNGVVNKLRGSSSKYVFDNLGLATYPENSIIRREYQEAVAKALQKQQPIPAPGAGDVFTMPAEVFKYLETHTKINSTRVASIKELVNARGQISNLDSSTIYIPPIDTAKQNFVAFVTEPVGKFGASSEKHAIVASSADSLAKKIQLIKERFGDQFEVFTKNDVKEFYKIKGEYDSQLMFNEFKINNSLARQGILSDVIPRTDSHVLDEFNGWHYSQISNLNRGMLELRYGQEFAELRQLGKEYTNIATSQGKTFINERTVKNPYEDMIHTGLNQSKLGEYKTLSQINEFVESSGTTLWNSIKSAFSKAAQGEIGWAEANQIMKKYGYENPYGSMADLALANTSIPKPVIQGFIQKANGALATGVLRLDFLDTLMNILSTPTILGPEISNIRRAITGNSEAVGRLSSLMNVGIPGVEGAAIPSIPKLVSNAIGTFFKDKAIFEDYKKLQFFKTELDAVREMAETATLEPSKLSASYLQQKGEALVNLGVKVTGNDWSQGFTRFIAADIMRQIGTAAGLSRAEIVSYQNTFLNRVMGNLTASQRPVLFQGPVGNAIGLFQTYQFNLVQNAFRFLETGDKKAVGMMLGMQNTLYGLQSNPAFYAINTNLVGNNTPGHEDIISGTYKVVGKDIGDWIMYGIGSNAINTNIYSRGDLTPRYATVIPTSVLELPIVNATARFASTVWETAKRTTQGGLNGQILLDGLAHNGINRPLAGIAQVVSGRSTTNAGNLISSNNDLASWSNASRILGGRPLDEAIQLDSMYRFAKYKALDKDRIETYGAIVKSKLAGDKINTLSTEDWREMATGYAAAGGRIENFNGWVHRQMLGANQSVVNKMKTQLTDPVVRNMQTVMGGELPDFLNTPIPSTPVTLQQ